MKTNKAFKVNEIDPDIKEYVRKIDAIGTAMDIIRWACSDYDSALVEDYIEAFQILISTIYFQK